jgi:hypothetical protein
MAALANGIKGGSIMGRLACRQGVSWIGPSRLALRQSASRLRSSRSSSGNERTTQERTAEPRALKGFRIVKAWESHGFGHGLVAGLDSTPIILLALEPFPRSHFPVFRFGRKLNGKITATIRHFRGRLVAGLLHLAQS